MKIMMKINEKTIFCLIILFKVNNISGNEVLHRLEFPPYDGETLRKMKPTQQLLDNFLEYSLQALPNLKKPHLLETLNYNEEQIEISFKDLKMTAENSSITVKSELLQQILRIELMVKNIYLDGISTIKTASTNQKENFRFTSQNVLCSGTGGLLLNTDDISSEWVLLDCLQKHFSPLKIIFYNTLKDRKLNDGGINLDFIETGLLRNIEAALSSIYLLELNEALNQLDPGLKKLLHNAGNTKLARMETSDSNEFLDAAISVVSSVIKERYNDKVQLPDIKEVITCSLLSLLHCDTGFIAHNGFAREVSTLQRIGNARITRRNVTIDFAGTLKFQKLDVYYQNYRATLLGIGPTGTLRLLSEPVVFGIQIRINFGNRRITLINFKLQTLGKTEVIVSGLGMLLGSVLGRVTMYIVGIFNAQISKIIENRVTAYIQETLKRNTIDDIISGNLTYKK